MLVVEMLCGQDPLLIVQRKTVVPTLMPVIALVASVGFVTVPVPEITDQLPVPVEGTFPVRLVLGEAIQML